MDIIAKQLLLLSKPEADYKDIFEAAADGSFAAITSFIEGDGGYNKLEARNAQNETIAHLCAQHGHRKIVEWCLWRNETFFTNALDSSGNTIMDAAVIGGSLPVVEYLASRNVALWKTHQNWKGDTALHLAARYGRLEIVKFLVREAKMEYDVRNDCVETPAHVAARYDHFPVLSYLIWAHPQYLEARDIADYHLLHWAAQNGNEYAVHEICRTYHVDTRIASKVTGQYPIHLAVEYGHMDATKMLVQCGAEPMTTQSTYPWYTVLHVAAAAGNVDALMYYLIRGFSDYSVKNKILGQTPILAATVGNRLNTVKYFVDMGVDASVTDNEGNTILHYAAKNQDVSIPKYLLDERRLNLQLDAKNKKGQTCVHVATLHDNLDFLRYMVESKQNQHMLDVPASNGYTPRMEAARRNNETTIEFMTRNNGGHERVDKRSARMEAFYPSFQGPIRARRMVTLDFPPLPLSNESTGTSSPRPVGILENWTTWLLAPVLKRMLGFKSNNGSFASDLPQLPLSPPEMVRSRMDQLAIDAIYEDRYGKSDE